MPVLAKKSEPRCKLCATEHRPAVDALLEKRSRGESDSDGRRINLEYVLEAFASWGIANPTEDNVKNHWRKHCEVVEAATVEAEAAAEAELADARLAVLERVLGANWREVTPSPEQLLELERALFPYDLVVKIRSGQPLGLTFDTVHRGIDSATRRRHEETQGELVKALAGATGKALDAALAGARQPKQLPPVHVDAEVVAEQQADDE